MLPHQFVLTLAWLPIFTEAARILAFFPLPLKSHQFVFQPLLRGLAQKGHHITYVTGIEMKDKVKNIEEVLIGDIMSDDDNQLAVDPYSFRHDDTFKISIFHWGFGLKMTEIILANPIVQEFLRRENVKYDVIISEILFSQEPFIALGNLFDAPVIDFSSQCGTHYVHDVLFNPTLFSYVADYRSPYSDRMSLYERLHNTLLGLFQIYGTYWYAFPREEALMNAYFNTSVPRGTSLKTLLHQNIAASIFNSDPVLGYPRPMFPQSIEVGGISVHPKKPLPKELQNFMDEAKTGVIYFSFGSILAGEKMPSKQKAYFVEAFKRLDQKVIWKYEGALDIELPPNVLLQKWLPQGDILAHPNCRIFITHCGYLSLVETVDRGIPIIGIPFFADQPRNCHMAQEKGFGVHLNFDDLTPEIIVDTVNKILKNKSYSDSAKRISSIFKDRLVSPVDKAVHLVEYVIRHGGNPSSQTGAKELWWFQYFLLDVTAIIIFSVLVFFMSIYKICRVIFSLLTCNSSKKTISTSRNQSKMSKKVK